MSGQQLQQMLPILVVGMVFSVVIGLWVAMEAWERGSPRIVSVLWFIAIVLFSPVAIFFAMMRIREIAAKARSGTRPGTRPTEPTREPNAVHKCPYCNEPLRGNDRICAHCGKLL